MLILKRSTTSRLITRCLIPNEDMYIKVKNHAADYDVIIPSDYMIEKMEKEGMLEELDFDNIPNYKYIGDDFKNLSLRSGK